MSGTAASGFQKMEKFCELVPKPESTEVPRADTIHHTNGGQHAPRAL
jgi:hypothetical protein